MLQGPFYTVESLLDEADTLKATLVLNGDHDIFKGHFPGYPVVPGVCMMQMVRELMEQVSSTRLRIVNGENLKFLNIINPVDTPRVDVLVTFSMEGDSYRINATIQSDKVTFFKFKGGLQRL